MTGVDPAITARAKEWLHRTQTGTIDRAQLDGPMNAALTDAAEKQVAAQFGPLGDPADFTYVDKKSIADSTAYIYRVTFKTTSLYWLFSINGAGKVSGLRYIPKQ